jgi:hypothetical protein
VDENSVIERTDDFDDDLDFDLEDEAIIYAGQDLDEASIEELREFADELQIDDYEDMSRATLMREIRDRI